MKTKYFCGTVQKIKSIGLLGFLSIAWNRSAANRLKKAESELNRSVAGYWETVLAAAKQTP